jgi:hypothetical protein
MTAELDRAMQLNPYYPDTYLHFLAQCHFSLRQDANAEAVLRRRLVRNSDPDISRVLLTACYGHLGRPDHAQVEWQEVLRVNPSYSLEHRRQILPYRNPAELEHLIEGLRKEESESKLA